MAQLVRPATVDVASWRNGALAAGGVLLAGVLLRAVDPGQQTVLQNFLLVFASLLVEAVPFVLMGALVSALIEVFVPASMFERLAALPGPLQLPAAGIAGFAFPVCECGSVPVARRLASKGLSSSATVTFMLAAPILNPIVIASTIVAYRGRDTLWPMVLGRTGLGLVAAMAVGWVAGGRTHDQLLRDTPASDPAGDAGDADQHRVGGGPSGRVGAGGKQRDHGRARLAAFFGHVAGDFVFMARFLVFGAAVAATLQTFVPQDVVGSVAGAPIIDLVALMGLAFLLSLCSESDAFVAASFVQFGVGAQLAFLVFGPMVDTKLAFLYTGTFKAGFFRTVIVVVGAVTLAGTLWIEVLAG
ncbi:MAG: permease [Actinobacteria bacterium]|nr:permease [Actinomycetota bacterium]